jgi:hypothetical protein
MPRIIALFVSAYWMAFFGLLTLAAMAEATGEVFLIFQSLSLPGALPVSAEAGPVLSSALAVGFLLVAVLFLWTLATALLQRSHGPGETDEVARTAFGVAAGMMTVLLGVGVGYPVPGLFASASLQLLALLVSYVAIYAEQRRATHGGEDALSGTEATARLMALGAAHDSMMPRLSGRGPDPEKRF